MTTDTRARLFLCDRESSTPHLATGLRALGSEWVDEGGTTCSILPPPGAVQVGVAISDGSEPGPKVLLRKEDGWHPAVKRIHEPMREALEALAGGDLAELADCRFWFLSPDVLVPVEDLALEDAPPATWAEVKAWLADHPEAYGLAWSRTADDGSVADELIATQEDFGLVYEPHPMAHDGEPEPSGQRDPGGEVPAPTVSQADYRGDEPELIPNRGAATSRACRRVWVSGVGPGT